LGRIRLDCLAPPGEAGKGSADSGAGYGQEGETISVKDVIEAAENRTFEVNCDVHKVSAVRCHDGNPCSIRPVWRELQRRVDDTLASISLGDLMLEEAEVQELIAV
jgi:DNA-binding IscR family transcriptional regulator